MTPNESANLITATRPKSSVVLNFRRGPLECCLECRNTERKNRNAALVTVMTMGFIVGAVALYWVSYWRR